jgi:hypothetical protein
MPLQGGGGLATLSTAALSKKMAPFARPSPAKPTLPDKRALGLAEGETRRSRSVVLAVTCCTTRLERVQSFG